MGVSVDALFFGLLTISGLMVAAIATCILFFSIRYRRGSQANRTLEKESTIGIETTWTVLPLIIFIGLFIWAAVIYFRMASPPDNALQIFVVAKQWMWK